MPHFRKSSRKPVIFNFSSENNWSKDDSRFGKKLLEKMGWKDGEGLGLNNQGISENIKARIKLDNKGLGYKMKEDEWLQVRSEFSELLAKLSQSDENELNPKDVRSLKVTSESSRSRVHYHKFTQSKDISRYDLKDIKGILGVDQNQKQESRIPEKEEFIQSGNMAEYFKKKMQKKRIQMVDSNNQPTDNDMNDQKLKQEDHYEKSNFENHYPKDICNDIDVQTSKKVNNQQETGSEQKLKKRKRNDSSVVEIIENVELKCENHDSKDINNKTQTNKKVNNQQETGSKQKLKKRKRNDSSDVEIIENVELKCENHDSKDINNKTQTNKKVNNQQETGSKQKLKKRKRNDSSDVEIIENVESKCENHDSKDINNKTEEKKMENRKTKDLSKAERIVQKARLLKKLQNSEVTHLFIGANLNEILGYGRNEVS